jgi:hypothetical protein
VIFPYIDLNIQTLQGSGQIRSSTAALAPGGYGQVAVAGAGMASSCSVTPGRPGMNGAVGRPPTGMASDRDVVVSRLSVAFTRIASQNAMERVRGGVAGCSLLPC